MALFVARSTPHVIAKDAKNAKARSFYQVSATFALFEVRKFDQLEVSASGVIMTFRNGYNGNVATTARTDSVVSPR